MHPNTSKAPQNESRKHRPGSCSLLPPSVVFRLCVFTSQCVSPGTHTKMAPSDVTLTPCPETGSNCPIIPQILDAERLVAALSGTSHFGETLRGADYNRRSSSTTRHPLLAVTSATMPPRSPSTTTTSPGLTLVPHPSASGLTGKLYLSTSRLHAHA